MKDEPFRVDTTVWAKPRAHLRGGEFCYRRNLLCTTSEFPDDLLILSGVFRHELTHFLQHCSTPYGLFLDELNFRRVALTQEFLKRHNGIVKTPIYHWEYLLRKSPQEYGENFPDIARKILCFWSATHALEQMLEGYDCLVLRDSTMDEALRALALCESSLRQFTDSEVVNASREAGSPTLSGPSSQGPCPYLDYAEEDGGEVCSHPFGALHLAEGVAQYQEGFEVVFNGTRTHKYLLAIGAFLERLGATLPAGDTQSTNAVKATFFALADLALFTPVGNIYSKLRHEGMTWLDIHPGYRFLMSLDLVAKSNAWITSLAEAEQLADEVCESLHWPQPKTFLQMGAELDDHAIFKRHKEASSIRLQDYMAFYALNKLLDHASPTARFFETHMPMVAYQGYGTICGFPDGEGAETTPITQVRNCFLGQFAWNVMGDRRGIRGEFFPPDLRFDLYFENIADLDDFWRLFSESRPWAARTRFDVL